jgi:uncharacterized protein
MTPGGLPQFNYHLDPVGSEVITASDGACVCCGKSRGAMYVGPAFTTRREVRDNICPWCVADGSAARKFDAYFAGAQALLKAGIAREIVDEVTKRTPGYFCWQSDQWQAHCNDACVFHGDATVEDVANASRDTIEAWKAEYNMKDQDWARLSDGYEPKGHSAFYKFLCRHCGAVRFSWDLD